MKVIFESYFYDLRMSRMGQNETKNVQLKSCFFPITRDIILLTLQYFEADRIEI